MNKEEEVEQEQAGVADGFLICGVGGKTMAYSCCGAFSSWFVVYVCSWLT